MDKKSTVSRRESTLALISAIVVESKRTIKRRATSCVAKFHGKIRSSWIRKNSVELTG